MDWRSTVDCGSSHTTLYFWWNPAFVVRPSQWLEQRRQETDFNVASAPRTTTAATHSGSSHTTLYIHIYFLFKNIFSIYIYIHSLKLPKRQNSTIRTAGFAVTHHRCRRIYAPSGGEDMWLVQETTLPRCWNTGRTCMECKWCAGTASKNNVNTYIDMYKSFK